MSTTTVTTTTTDENTTTTTAGGKVDVATVAEAAKRHITIKEGVADLDVDGYTKEVVGLLGTSVSEIKRAYEHASTIANGVARAIAEEAPVYMGEHKDCEEVNLKAKIAHEEVSINYKRNATSRNPATGAETQYKGGITMRRVVKSGQKQLGDIKSYAREIGAQKL